MLPVPALKPNEEPFDPNAPVPPHPLLKAGSHAIAFPPSKAEEADMPAAYQPAAPGTLDEYLTRMLDHALVKEAITNLHIEDDAETETLRAYDQTRIGDIVPDYAKFVSAQKDKYAHLLKTNSQRYFFQQAAAAYFAQAPERARALRNGKIRQFQKETIERQNEEFLARALRPENLMNDRLQTRYRDMILHNLELLFDGTDGMSGVDAETAAADRKAVLDEAAKNLYRKIMDKRLAAEPRSLAPLLASPAVRRVFSGDELRTCRDTMKKAILSDTLSRKALDWVRDEVPVQTARSMAESQHPDGDERKTLMDAFHTQLHNANRKRFLRTLLDLDNAWRAIKEADCNPSAIPAWVKNGDPALLACVTRTLETRERHGGLHPPPDYAELLKCVEEFDPRRTAERLADAKNLYDLADSLGGPDSPAFLAVIRMLLGKSTPADKNWFRTLSQARKEFPAADVTDGGEEVNAFLEMVDECRSQKLRRDGRDGKDGREELDPLEIRTLVRDCLAEKYSAAPPHAVSPDEDDAHDDDPRDDVPPPGHHAENVQEVRDHVQEYRRPDDADDV